MLMDLVVSVVVPTYRRDDLLARCLAALAAQDLPPSHYEVLVVDDANSMVTRSLVEKMRGCFPARLRYLAVRGTHGPAAARNLGWRAASTGLVAFTDDDCLPTRGWLRQGMAALAQGAAAAWGRIEVPLPAVPTDYERNEARLQAAGFVTANCFCRRDVLEAVGGFDCRFTAAWREDSDLYFSLVESGLPVVHVPQALVVHPLRPAPWGISVRQQRKTFFNALLYKKHPRLYRRWIPGSPRWYYVATGAAAMAALGTAAANLPLVLAGAAVWVLASGWFAARRLRGTSRHPSHVLEMLVTSALIPPVSLYWRLRGAMTHRVLFV